MAQPDARDLISQCNKLRSERAPFERNWQEIADCMRPLRSGFGDPHAPASRQVTRIFDSTALLAAESFAGGIYGMMTSPANRWFSLRLRDDDLNDHDPVRDWLYDVETRIFQSFGPQSSRFYAVLPALYADLACFGTAIFHTDEVQETGRISDSVRPLSECLLAEDATGEVDTVFRRFSLTGRQALSMFGDGLSTGTRKLAEAAPFGPVRLMHAVYPNGDAMCDALEPELRPFTSVYVEEETAHLVARGGYHEMPYHVPRWTQAAGETYGRGIGDLVLPDVKMLNRMDETALKAAQKLADPPLAAADKGLVRAAHTAPGGITYGAIDANGQVLVKPLYAGGSLSATLGLMEQRRDQVREAFHLSLMQMAGSPNMTATEWIGRQEEKLRLLGPNLGRLQSEFLSPLIRRRFGILLRAGHLPEPPPEIRGQPLSIEYVSPLARAQMAGEAQAVVRLYDSLLSVAGSAPGVLDNIDHDEAVQVLGRGWAVPARIMRGSDQVRALRSLRQAAGIAPQA